MSRADKKVKEGRCPSVRASQYTSAMVAAEPKNAYAAAAPNPRKEKRGSRKRPIPAPSAAPPEEPITYGSAIGFRKSPWNRRPATESAAPTKTDASTRGSRISKRNTESGLPEPSPIKNDATP